ncbi:hypothetical protein [Adhaeribacter radiodurans]|uniref:STAS/SEC14 domain-containing protein n=1 Tax=Adhaeribacter radiodurans TaxID=2745197 RepID=A0A7L7L272_9BACT|nr:hypothetical protein [Adhaeribacter radiodurans]QMU26863.1 hypothetical protein HUW48_01910 [Adhaeribacter radiodurans]
MNTAISNYPVFEDETHIIQIEKEHSLLCLTWKQHPDSTLYRAGYRHAIQAALAYKVQFWLTDSRKVPYLIMADQRWMYSKMRPLLKGGKIKKMALVLQPESLMMTDKYPYLDQLDKNTKTNHSLHFDFFLDLDSAYAWLLDAN